MDRQKIYEFLKSHEDYAGWNHPYRKYSPIAWNVKLYFEIDMSGKCLESPGDKEPIEERFDKAWEKNVKKDNHFFYELVEFMTEQAGVAGYCYGQCSQPFFEYSTYPGDDQGDWKFSFGGRSGGWLILAGWKHYDLLRLDCRSEFEDILEEWSNEELETFYRGVLAMDEDFSQPALKRLADSCVNLIRVDWEEDRRADERAWTAAHMYA